MVCVPVVPQLQVLTAKAHVEEHRNTSVFPYPKERDEVSV